MVLREELISRLISVSSRAGDQAAKSPDRINAVGMYRATYGAMADECIRQMEWARRECVTCKNDFPTRQLQISPTGKRIDSPLLVGGTEQTVEVVEIPLTLAPDEWKP